MFSRSSVKLQSARCHSLLLNRLFQSSRWFLECAIRVVGLCPALVRASGEAMRAFIFVYLTTAHTVKHDFHLLASKNQIGPSTMPRFEL